MGPCTGRTFSYARHPYTSCGSMAWAQNEISEEQLVELDGRIHRLASSHGRLRLRVGQALAMNDASQHHEYGFSSFDAYTVERLSVTGRWAADTRALASRLEPLPRIRAALEGGTISWCMADVLARDATAETKESILDEACHETIRTMRERLRARRPKARKLAAAPESAEQEDGRPLTAPEALMRDPLARELGICVDDLGVIESDSGVPEDDPMHMLAVTGPVEEQWLLEVTRMAVESVTGCEAHGAWIEPLLAEGLGTMLRWFPGADPISDEVRARREAARAMRALMDERRALGEIASTPAVVAHREVKGEEEEAIAEDPIPEDPWLRERRVRQWCAELASRDLWLGRDLVRLFAADGWRRLGYASETQYAQERLGMSRGSMRKHMRLAREAEPLGRLSQAVTNGEIGYEAALALLRVIGPDTEEVWVERAKRRTHKHLREELVMVETLARMTKSDLRDATPPTTEDMEAWFALERDAVTGDLYRRALERNGLCVTAVDAPDPADATEAAPEEAARSAGDSVQMFVGNEAEATPEEAARSAGDSVQMFVGDAEGPSANRHRGTVTRYWPVRESTLLFWRELEEAHRRSRMAMSFLTFLSCSFWAAWGPAICQPQDSVWQHIYDRDRRKCTCPVCTRRRRLEDHHLRWRSRGGGDEDENNAAACDFCHRPGVHEGRLRVFPPASRARWLIGRKPLLEVIGREKRELS